MLEFFLSSPRPELQRADREVGSTGAIGPVVTIPGRSEVHLVNMSSQVSTTVHWAAVPGGKLIQLKRILLSSNINKTPGFPTNLGTDFLASSLSGDECMLEPSPELLWPDTPPVLWPGEGWGC